MLLVSFLEAEFPALFLWNLGVPVAMQFISDGRLVQRSVQLAGDEVKS